MRRIAIAVVVAHAALARAQTVPCEPCARGEQLLAGLGEQGKELRAAAPELLRLWVPLGIDVAGGADPDEAKVLMFTLRDTPGLFDAVRSLRGLSNDEMLAIAAVLCEGPEPACTEPLVGALRVAAQVEPSDLAAMNALIDETPVRAPQTCDPTAVHTASPRTGLDFEYASGWQASAKPVEGAAWSLGVAVRGRVASNWNAVVRFDRSTGRDAASDANGDGRDDVATGAVTRWSALAGVSRGFATHRAMNDPRRWELDALGGWSRSGDLGGPIVAADLSYRFLAMRIGARVMQGFGDASEERAALVHVGLGFGAGPEYWTTTGCESVERRRRGSRWAIGVDVPAGGWLQHVGGIAPGFGLEAALHGKHHIDLLLRGDLLDLPNGDADRILVQSVLAGIRLDLSRPGWEHPRAGWLATAMGGYARVSGPSSSAVDSSPIIDVALGWGFQAADGAANVRVHARFGLAPDDAVIPAMFVSLGGELRLDRSRWRDRD
jgi:hypothetical protein